MYKRQSLDPARFHQGLLEAALSSGVSIKAQCEVQEVLQTKGLFHVSTSSGVVKAKHVVIATSGYNRQTPPWFKRRIIPIGSYIIATEELDPALVDELIPKTASSPTPENWWCITGPHQTENGSFSVDVYLSMKLILKKVPRPSISSW